MPKLTPRGDRLTFVVPVPLSNQLRHCAAAEGRSLSNYIAALLREAMAHHAQH